MLGSKSRSRTGHVCISLLLCVLVFGRASFAVTQKEYSHLISQTESWVANGKLTAIQVTFNTLNGDQGNFSLADGYLRFYNPDDVPEIEGLLSRGQTGAFQSLQQSVMEEFEFGNASVDHSHHSSFPTARKDEFFLILLRSGEVFIVRRTENIAVLPVENLQCDTGGFFEPGYYMTGFIHEKNATTLVSFVIRNVDT